MLQTLSLTKILTGAAIDDSTKVFALGNNQALTFAVTSAGGMKYVASATPRPDRMRVQHFAVTVTDANSRALRGVRVAMGMLTAFAHDPVVFLMEGVVGDNGALWVPVPRPFVTEYGVFMQLPPYLASATYHLKGMVSYDT